MARQVIGRKPFSQNGMLARGLQSGGRIHSCQRLPVPRVASEASSVQSHYLNASLRRPAAPEANAASSGTPSPFEALLDDTTAPADDRSDRPQASAAPTNSPQNDGNDGRVRRGNDDEQPPTVDAGQTDAPSDASIDAATAVTTDGKSDTARVTAATTAGDVAAATDTTETETTNDATSDVTSAQLPTPDIQAIVTPVTAPAAVVPTMTADATIQAGTTSDKDGASAATQAVAALSAPAQDAGAVEVPAGTKGKNGSQGPDASKYPAANKVLNAKQRTETSATLTTSDAAPADGDAPSGPQAAAQPGSTTDPNVAGKSAHAPALAGRSPGVDATAKTDDADTRVATTAPAATDKPADTLQVTPLAHQPTDRTTAPAAAAAAAAPTTDTTSTTVPVAGLAVEITGQAQAGRNRFEIRLDPPELGRIDVRLDVHKDGQVTSRLVVEKAETLDLLRRDAPQLERALQDAGLKTSDNGLQFSLRDQGPGGQNQAWSDGGRSDAARLVVPDSDMPPVETVQSSYGSALRAGGGVDIRV
jgi:flagellar hook-length control protein FliK